MAELIISAAESLWHFLFGWPSVAILIGIAATAAAIFSENIIVKFAIPDLRKWAVVVAVIAFSFTAIAGKFYNDGLSEMRRQWNESLAAGVTQGEADRAAAVADEPADVTDRGVFQNDPYNRDGTGADGIEPKSKVRWLASHHLFGKW